MINLISKTHGKFGTIIRHVLFILAYYLYEIRMLYLFTGQGIYFWDALIHFLVNLGFFYFNAHVVLAFAESRRGKFNAILHGIVLVSFEVLIFLAAKYVINTQLPQLGLPATRPFLDWGTFIRDMLWRFFYLFGLSTAYWFALSSAAKQARIATMEHIRLRELAQQEITKQELLRTENAFLRAQINSHFLFNTLNYLHSSVHDLKADVGQTILDLSSILRYSFKTTAEGKVLLSEELEHIQHIFNITRIKSSRPLQLEYSIKGEPEEKKIIPLVLLTLAENMLKYADLYAEDQPARFSCQITNRQLTVRIQNKKRKAVSPLSSGIGMENLKKRLNLAYHENYTLDVINSESDYFLTLIISLDDALQHDNGR